MLDIFNNLWVLNTFLLYPVFYLYTYNTFVILTLFNKLATILYHSKVFQNWNWIFLSFIFIIEKRGKRPEIDEKIFALLKMIQYFNVTHAWWKTGLFGEKKNNAKYHCSRSNRMPLTDQITWNAHLCLSYHLL